MILVRKLLLLSYTYARTHPVFFVDGGEPPVRVRGVNEGGELLLRGEGAPAIL